MTIVHPIEHAWITTGQTGAQNYDEFADDAEITAIIAENPQSALAIEMPHRAPESLGKTFADSLPDAADRLAQAKADGFYVQVENAVVLYRITDPTTDTAAYGMFCLLDTAQISGRDDEPGLVIRNEDVFIEKVRERVALTEATDTLLSPVLLMQTAHGDKLQAELVSATAAAGAPMASDTDGAGRTHEVWPVPPGPAADRLRELAGGGELVVADGNHRSLAAQIGGLSHFLAVVTTPSSVSIDPYHRLVQEMGMSAPALLERLRAAGATVTPLETPPETPAQPGTIHLYLNGSGHAVALPAPDSDVVTERLDHALTERVLFGDVLGLDPGDKRIRYIGGDYPPRWLRGEVDAGRAELAVLISPVTVEDFVAVNLARQKMPRKSTWFTPKARAGLVLAELHR
ncbi:DUF1015 family protein [Phytoactinopolyspora mesophila]|uniref:DUF1015 family protein n=1 Tax=Phytoactinopolyspora mesophila TaxID=2650750 RepID=A0A7K3M5R0_9ACTN|nr:DUF1015 family protein [Phytoactinopolyspora mesophila]NDL58252.1 DUF1015 family protein [Phytoactinopolyspora mesophila]